MITETKNPSTVKIPAILPPCSYDSGIIEFASINKIAPPAKACMNASHSPEVFLNSEYPATDEAEQIKAITNIIS